MLVVSIMRLRTFTVFSSSVELFADVFCFKDFAISTIFLEPILQGTHLPHDSR